MKDTIVAHKYALALFQLAEANNLVDQIEEEVKVVKEIFSQDKQILSFLTSPKIGKDKKRELINEAFGEFNPFVINTLLLLLDRQRAQYILTVIDEFIQISYENKGIAKAHVESGSSIKRRRKRSISKCVCEEIEQKIVRNRKYRKRRVTWRIKNSNWKSHL